MAEAVEHSFDTGEHLAVQAGTGTGKSLAYLVPGDRARRRDQSAGRRLDRDHRPAAPTRRPRPAAAGRCTGPRTAPQARLRAAQGPRKLPVPQQDSRRHHRRCRTTTDSQEELFDAVASTALGRDVKRLTEWSSDTETGDRDELMPGVPDRSWGQVSVSARECVGATPCPYGTTASPRRPGPWRARPTWSSPTTRCWPSTPSPTSTCYPNTNCWSSTRRTNSSTA